MTTSNRTQKSTKDHLSSAFTKVDEQIKEAQRVLQKAVDDLDAVIAAKTDQLNALNNSVTRAEATAMVAEDMRRSLQGRRQALKRRAMQAAALSAHAPTSNFGSINGDGRHQRSIKEPKPLRILDDISVMDLAAIVLDDAAINAFASEAIEATEAPIQGPSVAELAERANALADELEDLHQQRLEARKQLSDFIGISLSPLVPDSFFQRRATSSNPPDFRRPSVSQIDEHGRDLQKTYGPTMNELIDYRNRLDGEQLTEHSETYNVLGLRDAAMDGDRMPTSGHQAATAPRPSQKAMANVKDALGARTDEGDLYELPQDGQAELSGMAPG